MRLFICTFMLALACLAGCAKKTSSDGEAAGGGNVLALESRLKTPLSDDEAWELGERLATEFGETPRRIVTDFLTEDRMTALLKKHPLYQKLNMLEQKKLLKQVPAMITQATKGMEKNNINSMTYVGCRHDANRSRLVVRVTLDAGFIYYVFYAGKTADGEIVAEDVFLPTVNDTFGGMFAGSVMLDVENAMPISAFQQLFSKDEVEKLKNKRTGLQRMSEAMLQGENKQAVRTYEVYSLDQWKSIQIDAMYSMVLTRIAMAEDFENPETLEKIAKLADRFQELYPASNVHEMTLLDVTMIRRDEAGYLKIVDSLGRKLVPDPLLTKYCYGIFFLESDPPRALELFREAKADGVVSYEFYVNYLVLLKEMPESQQETAEILSLVSQHFGEDAAATVIQALIDG